MPSLLPHILCQSTASTKSVLFYINVGLRYKYDNINKVFPNMLYNKI